MFLTFCSPSGSKPNGSFFSTSLATFAGDAMPPGSASACSRAAMLTPSPWLSSPSTMTSPRLIPILHLKPAVLGNGGVAFGQPALQRDGAFDRVDDAGEFGQHAVAHQLEDVAVVAGNFGLEQFLASGRRRSNVPASSRSIRVE